MRRSFRPKLRHLAMAALLVAAGLTATPASASADVTVEADCPVVSSNGFAHFHASGMWTMGIKRDHGSKLDVGLTVAQERQRLRKEADSYRAEATIVTHTEAGRPKHWKNIRKNADPCWKAFPKNGAEETVEWDSHRWAAQEKRRETLVKVSNRTITATVVRLKERAAPAGRAKRQVVVIVSHLPAHVEGKWDANTPRVKKHKKAMKALQHLVAASNNAFPKATIIVAGDWNLNHKAKFKGAIKRHLTGPKYTIRSAWTKENTGHSLYGSKRLIDGDWYVNAKRCGAYVKDVPKKSAASDHIPYRVRYAFGNNC